MVMGLPAGYVRKGKPIAYQFDHDAVVMLYELVPTNKSHGRFLSELVRREYLRRQEWERARAALPAVVEVAGA
jgi:hypothetical protein